MEKKEVLKKIKEVILSIAKKHGIEIDKIILFGSRARGDYTKESDWDIAVIVKNYEREIVLEFLGECFKNFADKNIQAEVVVIGKDEHERKKRDIGYLSYWIEKEGLVL